MKALGIIAEYNPLHNGHVYNMKEARRLAGCDAVVVAMSGDFVQRGEPAILNKWERSKLAVMNGADLVVEIPALYCLGNAGQYASAGVRILESISSVEKLAFGSETGETHKLERIAQILDEHQSEIDGLIKSYTGSGMSYPAARQAAIAEITGECISLDSNDILGLEYIRALTRLKPVAVPRVGAGYHDVVDEIQEFQSATGIRRAIAESGCDAVRGYVPESVYDMLDSIRTDCSEEWLKILKYSALNMPSEDIDDCPSGDAGIGTRIKSAVAVSDTWEDFILNVKSRNYTYSRISRLCCQIILGITRSAYSDCDVSYLRVLAMNDRGRSILAEMRENEEVTLITKVGRKLPELKHNGDKLLQLDLHASDVYNLVAGLNMGEMSDYRKHPYIGRLHTDITTYGY